jgi:hypothetical protein
MSKKFSFTQKDLDEMITNALNIGNQTEVKASKPNKPNIINKLLSSNKLNQNKRQ